MSEIYKQGEAILLMMRQLVVWLLLITVILMLTSHMVKANEQVNASNLNPGQVTSCIDLKGDDSSILYDPQNGYIYVGGSSIYVINPLNNQIMANISLPKFAWVTDLLYDPQNGYIYAADKLLNTVFIINPSTKRIHIRDK